jgi:hypothetical protein
MSFFKKLVNKLTSQDKSKEKIERQQLLIDNEGLTEEQNIKFEDSTKAVNSHYERLFGEQIQDDHNDDEYDSFSIADFEELDVEGGEFEIFAVNLRGKNEGKSFYQNGQEKIAKFFANCTFHYEGNLYRCGYDYKLLINQNGQCLYRMMICFNCGDVIVYNSNNQLIHILAYEPIDLIELFHEYFSIMIRKMHQFPSRQKGMTFWETEKNNPKLLSYPNELSQWLSYKGEYMVWLKFDANDEVTHQEANNILAKTIQTAVGHSNFDIQKSKEAGDYEIVCYGSLVASSKEVFNQLMEKEPSIMPLNQEDGVPAFMNKNWTLFMDFELELFYHPVS